MKNFNLWGGEKLIKKLAKEYGEIVEIDKIDLNMIKEYATKDERLGKSYLKKIDKIGNNLKNILETHSRDYVFLGNKFKHLGLSRAFFYEFVRIIDRITNDIYIKHYLENQINQKKIIEIYSNYNVVAEFLENFLNSETFENFSVENKTFFVKQYIEKRRVSKIISELQLLESYLDYDYINSYIVKNINNIDNRKILTYQSYILKYTNKEFVKEVLNNRNFTVGELAVYYYVLKEYINVNKQIEQKLVEARPELILNYIEIFSKCVTQNDIKKHLEYYINNKQIELFEKIKLFNMALELNILLKLDIDNEILFEKIYSRVEFYMTSKDFIFESFKYCFNQNILDKLSNYILTRFKKDGMSSSIYNSFIEATFFTVLKYPIQKFKINISIFNDLKDAINKNHCKNKIENLNLLINIVNEKDLENIETLLEISKLIQDNVFELNILYVYNIATKSILFNNFVEGEASWENTSNITIVYFRILKQLIKENKYKKEDYKVELKKCCFSDKKISFHEYTTLDRDL